MLLNQSPSLPNTLLLLLQKVWPSAKRQKTKKGKSMQGMMKMQNAQPASKPRHKLKVVVAVVVAVAVVVLVATKVVEAVSAVVHQPVVAAVAPVVAADKQTLYKHGMDF